MSRIIANNIRHNDAASDSLSFDSSARVGIGTASPTEKLHLSGSGGTVILVADSSSYAGLSLSGSGSSNFIVSDDRLDFLVNGSTRASILTTGGITFNGDTAAANALDDYEEGTWTPVFKGAGTAGSYTLNVREASYTKIGRMVHLYCDIVISTVNSAGSAYAVLEGMPFDVGSQSIGSCSLSGVDIATAGTHYHVTRVSGVTDHRLYFFVSQDNASPYDIQVSEFSSGDSVMVTMMYTAA